LTEHPIQGLMKTAMESIREMIDVNTIVGDPVEAQDGSVIMPISRVSFGFAAGGAEYGSDSRKALPLHDRDKTDSERSGAVGLPFGGGSGAGVSIKPVGFLVVGQGRVRLLPVDGRALYDRLIDAAPQLIQEIQSAIRGNGGTYERPGHPDPSVGGGQPLRRMRMRSES
jgi:sporulation protein YtfJ